MNFIDLDVVASDGGYRAQRESLDLRLPDDVSAALEGYGSSLDDVSFGVRPEDLHDASETQTVPVTDENTFDAEVRVVEPMGSDKFLTLEPFEDRSEISARVSPESDAAVGDIVTLAVDMTKIHVFDERTGNNVTQHR